MTAQSNDAGHAFGVDAKGFPGELAAENIRSTMDNFVIDAVMASSAAPTVFPTHQGHTDGGIAANNPSMVAVSMAFRTIHKDLNSVRIFSIGGGMYPGAMKHTPICVFFWIGARRSSIA